jgi:hypothetical protein
VKLPPAPQPGLVLCYSYLWKDEQRAARVEGRKDRPVVVVLATRSLAGSTLVYVAPVTHDARHGPGEAIEIPAVVKRHLGLDDAASFIVATELNVFVWPGSDLRPIRRARSEEEGVPCWYGYLPRGLFGALKQAIDGNARGERMRMVKR